MSAPPAFRWTGKGVEPVDWTEPEVRIQLEMHIDVRRADPKLSSSGIVVFVGHLLHGNARGKTRGALLYIVKGTAVADKHLAAVERALQRAAREDHPAR